MKQPDPPPPHKTGESLVHEWFRRVWEEGDLDAIDELMDQDNLSVGLVDDPVSKESFRAVYDAFSKIFKDVQVEVGKVFEEGDSVAGQWVLNVTHRASGKRMDFPGSLFARTRRGRFLHQLL